MKSIHAMAKAMAVCVALGFLSGGLLQAEVQFNLITGEPIHTQADMDALSPGDTVVMACPNCKAMSMVTVTSGTGPGGKVTPGDFAKACKECGGKVTAVTGKNGEVKFMCSQCKTEVFASSFKKTQK